MDCNERNAQKSKRDAWWKQNGFQQGNHRTFVYLRYIDRQKNHRLSYIKKRRLVFLALFLRRLVALIYLCSTKKLQNTKAQDLAGLVLFCYYILRFAPFAEYLNLRAVFCPAFQKTGFELTTSLSFPPIHYCLYKIVPV